MTYPRIIGIGETVLDIIFKTDQPQAAIPGGSTFNSIISLSRAGCYCAMVTEVGDDHVGDIICQYLSDNQVSLDYVCRHAHAKSHISLAFLDEHNDARYQFYKDHAGVRLDGQLPTIEKLDFVLFGSFFAINPTIREQVRALLNQAHDAGAFLYYDINFRKPHVADLPVVFPNLLENMRLATIVRGSTEDFFFLFGEKLSADEIYARVRPYCELLILTDGPGVVRVYSPQIEASFAAEAIHTVSTVGAGDNFNAGFLFALSRMAKEYGRLKGTMSGLLDDCSLQTWQVLINMAQSWARNVCMQLGNSITHEFAKELKQ